MNHKLSCPSCECSEVTTTWIDYEFQYGDKNHVMLKCKVPLRSCLCGEKWLDHIAEDIMQEVVRVHLLPVIDDAWLFAAKKAAERIKAFDVSQLAHLMGNYKVPIDEMDEWCLQRREDYPCFFQANIGGIMRDIQAIIATKVKNGWRIKIGKEAETLANQVSPIKFACPVCGEVYATEKAAKKCRDQPYDDGGLKIGDIVVVPGKYRNDYSLNDPWLAFEIPPDPTSNDHFDCAGYRVPYFVVTAFHGDERDKHRCLVTLATLCGGLQLGWNSANGDGHYAMYRIDGCKHCDKGSTWIDDIKDLLAECNPSPRMREEAARLARVGISTTDLL